MSEREQRERLVELLKQTCHCKDEDCSNCSSNGICFTYKDADHLLENGVIVPPVKVGQTVYYIGGIYNGIRPIRSGTIEGIVITPKGVSELWINGGNGIYYLRTTKENFYLTKEEAEKALKGGAANE